MPVLHLPGPGREALLDQAAVLLLVQGDDPVGRGEVGSSGLQGEAFAGRHGHAAGGQALDDGAGDGPDVPDAPLHRQTARLGPPVQALPLGQGVKEVLGEAAAVVVTGAEKEDLAHGRPGDGFTPTKDGTCSSAHSTCSTANPTSASSRSQVASGKTPPVCWSVSIVSRPPRRIR